MSPFALKFSQMILHTETSKLMYNRSFLFEVLHQPTLLPSTFNVWYIIFFYIKLHSVYVQMPHKYYRFSLERYRLCRSLLSAFGL